MTGDTLPAPLRRTDREERQVMRLEAELPDDGATVSFGMAAARASRPGAVFYLEGPLGAGKTTFARGFLTGLGHTGPVKSPTYTLVEPYSAGSLSIYHFDLYRVSDPEELELMGIRDYFDGSSVCLVERPDRGEGLISPPDVTVRISYSGSSRKAEAESSTPLGDQIISGWNK